MSHPHLTYCCPACQRVKDQHGDGSAEQDWCTMADYVKRHPAPGPVRELSECYCADCSMSYDRLVQYSRASQAFVL